MAYFWIFDYLSIVALAFMSYGVLKQWRYIYKNKSVKDIVTQEVVIRLAVTAVLLIKILLVGDKYLIIGQTIFMISITIYGITLIFLKFRETTK